MSNFKKRVIAIVRDIPTGEVLSYKQVAAKAGYQGAARAVANLMAQNYNHDVPCHRVIKSDGTAGGYNRGGEVRKQYLLAMENVIL